MSKKEEIFKKTMEGFFRAGYFRRNLLMQSRGKEMQTFGGDSNAVI